MSEYDYGDQFEEALLKAMLEPLSEGFEPCCSEFGKSLHHHWPVPEGTTSGVLLIPDELEFPEDV